MDRVIAEATRFLGEDRVGPAGSGVAVEVGTERDLPGLQTIELAVIVDADGVLRAPNYRAVEDGFRVMARVVAAAGPGRGRRAIVQTADPAHPAIDALRRGDPAGLIGGEIERRAALGFPPHGELLVVEMEGAPAGADRSLREAVADRGAVLGPADRDGRVRWLVQGRDLRPARLAMRGLVQDWRDAGARVRIDADPIDL
jgi:primosomal protein N'